MATLKEFEEALRQSGMVNALAILEQIKKRDRDKRSIAPARRVVGRKMTAELARTIVEMHASTGMTQQEIAFKLGVNQGRVNEVIKRGKWLNADPKAPEAQSRDKAMERLDHRAKARRKPQDSAVVTIVRAPKADHPKSLTPPTVSRQLPLAASEPSSVIKVRSTATCVPLRRDVEPSAPIVSAQLAFLDL